jgi:hypothetical protein
VGNVLNDGPGGLNPTWHFESFHLEDIRVMVGTHTKPVARKNNGVHTERLSRPHCHRTVGPSFRCFLQTPVDAAVLLLNLPCLQLRHMTVEIGFRET